jgi:hypothetical protein
MWYSRLKMSVLKGRKVTLLDEAPALGVFGDAHDDVRAFGEQPELEVGVCPLAPENTLLS